MSSKHLLELCGSADTWPNVSLGEVCEINPRTPRPKRHIDELTTFIPMSAVDQHTGTVPNAQLRPYHEIRTGYTFFHDGDVLFAKITPCMQNGKHFVAHNLVDGIGFGSTEFHVLRPSSSLVADWLHHFLRQDTLLTDATHYFRGTAGQQRLPAEYLIRCRIPLPPTRTQQQISAILSNMWHGVNTYCQVTGRKCQAVTNELPRSLLHDAFSQIASSPKFRLGSMCDIVTGKTPPTKTSRYWNGNHVWVTTTDLGKIRGRHISDSDRCITADAVRECNIPVLPANTVIMSTTASVGYLGISEEPLCIGTGCRGFLPRAEITSDFLYWQLRYLVPEILSLCRGTTIVGVTKSALQSLLLSVPDIPTQLRISQHLDNNFLHFNAFQAKFTNSSQLINQLNSAVLQMVFSGVSKHGT